MCLYESNVLANFSQAYCTPRSEWLFTKYDAFGRVVYTGLYTNEISRESLQVTVNNTAMYSQYVSRTATKNMDIYNATGTSVYYDNASAPQGMVAIHTINYYDSYVDADGLTIPSQVYGVPKAIGIGTKGLSTVNKTRVLGTDQWITTITGYDRKGRVIYSGEQNDYLNTTTIVQNDLDFAGKVEERKTQHRKGAGLWIVTVDKYSYDHSGRLADHYQCIGEGSGFNGCDDSADGESFTLTEAPTGTWNKTASNSITLKPGFHFIASSGKSFHGSIARKGELIAENTYDDLGQLISKGVGNTTAQPLQTVAYAYNIRGWLKKINNPSSLGTNLFGIEIKYNDITDPTKKLYNGNISQTFWNTQSVNPSNNPISNQYTYSYDALNRITGAVDNTTNFNVSGITYDQNGNITKLLRKGHTNEAVTSFGTMDNLTYSYDSGNKLLSVTDAVATPILMKGEFKDGNKTGNDYNYDENGNLNQDLNKGIAAGGITYNHLNLPTSIDIGTGNISYIYDALGTKLQKRVTEGSSVTSITDYSGNYIYENGDLKFFSHAEGYVNTEGGSYKYVYQYKDHLGNIRLSYTDDPSNPGTPTIIEENNYYPFGLKHKGYNNGTSSLGNSVAQRWKYNGKEYDESLDINTYDFGARNYNPAIGRWMNVDPLAYDPDQIDKSPYAFAWNNPIMYVDPTGLKPETIYENINSGETVEVDDGIDKTIRVNDSDFQKAQFFANEINPTPDENSLTTIGVSRDIADGYNEFYNSVNSYDGFSLSNLYDYAFNEPKLTVVGEMTGSAGALELIGGPVVKSGTTLLKGLKGLVNPKKTVVIGEDMLNRVIPYAEKNGYKYFKPRGKNPANWMRNQKQWIYRQVKDPHTEIINIGPKGAKPVSKYYKAELEGIKKIKSN